MGMSNIFIGGFCMQEIIIFNNPDFGVIRTITIDGEPWLVGIDVAKALGYKKPTDAVNNNVEEDDSRREGVTDNLGRVQQTIVINESGLYSLIFNSKLDSAKRFKKWVTSEILPSIRKTGEYKQDNTGDVQGQIKLLAQGTTELYERVEGAENRIKELEDTMNLDYGQQRILEKSVNKTVISCLGGKDSNAYKQIGRKVFAECNGDLKDFFKVNARANVPRRRYEEAVIYSENWKPCTNTAMLIEQYNAQQTLDLEGDSKNTA